MTILDLLEETTIEELDLSVRSYSCLKRAGINTADQLYDMRLQDYMKIRNICKRHAEEIMMKLDQFIHVFALKLTKEFKSMSLKEKLVKEYNEVNVRISELGSYDDDRIMRRWQSLTDY